MALHRIKRASAYKLSFNYATNFIFAYYYSTSRFIDNFVINVSIINYFRDLNWKLEGIKYDDKIFFVKVCW
jgi:hypothetical protein